MLKFYAKSNELVRIPGAQPRPGQPDMYVGRRFDPETRSYPAVESGYEVDENSPAGQRLIRLTQIDSSLIPADQKTADICGVAFVPVEFSAGAFVEKKAAKNSKQPVSEG